MTTTPPPAHWYDRVASPPPSEDEPTPFAFDPGTMGQMASGVSKALLAVHGGALDHYNAPGSLDFLRSSQRLDPDLDLRVVAPEVWALYQYVAAALMKKHNEDIEALARDALGLDPPSPARPTVTAVPDFEIPDLAAL